MQIQIEHIPRHFLAVLAVVFSGPCIDRTDVLLVMSLSILFGVLFFGGGGSGSHTIPAFVELALQYL
jgi:hypothetical protein